MYEVLYKDTIKIEILPHLSVAKRGYATKSDLSKVIQYILYKLKTGCQWHTLPVSAIFTRRVLSYKTVYGHFRKWSSNSEWKKVWGIILERCKSFLDMSSVDLDDSHTTTLRGAVDTKDVRKGRPPMPYMSQTDKGYRLPCPPPFWIRTTTFTTFPRFFRVYLQTLDHLAWTCRYSFSMQTLALTLHNQEGLPTAGGIPKHGFQ